MPEPTAFLLALRASTADLIAGLEAEHWSDADVAVPSLCDGWTRGHVLTHLARNADGIAATLDGSLRGEIVARYPDGWDARNAAIDEGATRPLAVQLADVRDSADRLDEALTAVAEVDGWQRATDKGRLAEHWVYFRWREVEIHRIDLAGDYGPRRWPPLLIEHLLPEAAAGLADRVDGPVRVEVSAAGSLAPGLVGRVWNLGDGDPVEVNGPDWAVLAWLLGRPSAAADVLGPVPALGEWN